MLSPELLARIERACAQAPCIAAMGFRVLTADVGCCTLYAPQNPAYDGLLPGFHGGMLAMVADCAAWYAIVTQTGPEERLVTTDLFVRYLNPCLGGVTAAARVIKLGRTLVPVQIDMTDAGGKAVLTGQVTYLRLAAAG